MSAKLYYAHDPMCSWCYAFRPAFESLISGLSDQIEIVHLLGGLARDTDEPMPHETREFVQANWRRIEQQVPGTRFNYDFWHLSNPRRSTYPASRAVIAARQQGAEFDLEMIWAIQQAYYLQARNPSDYSVLSEIATEMGLNQNKFDLDIKSSEIDDALRIEINQSRGLGLNSFPSLLLEIDNECIRIEPDYNNKNSMLEKINHYFS